MEGTLPQPAKFSTSTAECVTESANLKGLRTDYDPQFVPYSQSKMDELNRQYSRFEGTSNILIPYSDSKSELATGEQFLKSIKTITSPVLNKLNKETRTLIERRNLHAEIAWLQTVASNFFPGADFEIELLPAEDEEENMLALRVYGALSASEFREQRHAICEAMIKEGYRNLYEVISIFQRRMRNDGRQAISWYSSLSAA